MTQDHQDKTQQLSQRALDRSVEGLSPETKRALYHARQHAMLHSQTKQHRWGLKSLLATACSATLVSVVWFNLPDTVQAPVELALETGNEAVDTFTYLTALDETEQAIVEDLEFAIWLSQELETGHDDGLSERT